MKVSICIPTTTPEGLDALLQQISDTVFPNGVTAIEVCVFYNGFGVRYDELMERGAILNRPKFILSLNSCPYRISLADSWRSALLMATGDVICLHSVNDPWNREFLFEMAPRLLLEPFVDFTCCREEPHGQEELDILYREINNHCKSLCDAPERKQFLLRNDISANFLGNIYKVLFRRKCLPLKAWERQTSSYPFPSGFTDWEFLLRLFLNHTGHFVDKYLSVMNYDADSPYVKLLNNPEDRAAARASDSIMALLVESDPSLSALLGVTI